MTDQKGQDLYSTDPVSGQNGKTKAAVAVSATVPDYETSAYIYIRSSVKKIYIDDFRIESADETAYEPQGAAVTGLSADDYRVLSRSELYSDPCTYGSPASIPERYKPNVEAAVFQDNSGCLQLYEKSKPEGHGLRMSIKDIIEDAGLKGGVASISLSIMGVIMGQQQVRFLHVWK